MKFSLMYYARYILATYNPVLYSLILYNSRKIWEGRRVIRRFRARRTAFLTLGWWKFNATQFVAMKFSINRLLFYPRQIVSPMQKTTRAHPVASINLNQHAFNVHNRVQSLDLISGKCCNLRRCGTLLETPKTLE